MEEEEFDDDSDDWESESDVDSDSDISSSSSKDDTPKEGEPGEYEAVFGDPRNLADDVFAKKIDWSTRTIRFRYNFKLTDAHIDKILALGPTICGKIRRFVFEHTDVSYDAHNDAKAVTPAAAVRLASACPNLRLVQLTGVHELGDAPLLAFLEKCPLLKSIEITPASRDSSPISKEALRRIRQHPEWAPRLEELCIQDSSIRTTGWKKAVKDLSRARPEPELVVKTVSEKKVWVDWEMDITETTYMNGRVVDNYVNTPY